jgi:hypothetical protein
MAEPFSVPTRVNASGTAEPHVARVKTADAGTSSSADDVIDQYGTQLRIPLAVEVRPVVTETVRKNE